MRSLKSVLGSQLLNEATQVGRARITFRDVIARYLAEVKGRAEMQIGAPLGAVVHGRPVHFLDGDPEGDRAAEDALRAIARSIGFAEISFQFEPIAAALDYEQGISGEEIALIADIGGGTSDFSIVRLSPQPHRNPDRQPARLREGGVCTRPVDEFEDEVVLAGVRVEPLGQPLHEVGVVELLAEVGFAVEAVDELGLSREVVGEEFHRNGPPARHVVAEINGTHSTFADPSEKAITGDDPRVGGVAFGRNRPVGVVVARHGQNLRARRAIDASAKPGISNDGVNWVVAGFGVRSLKSRSS